MSRLLLVAPLLLGACATPVTPPAASTGVGHSPLPASAIPPQPYMMSTAQMFVCHASARPSVHVRPEPLDEIRMSEPGDRSVSSGAFRFRVLYSDDQYESQCTDEEKAILEADAAAERLAGRAEDEALRDSWFELLKEEAEANAQAAT